MREHSNEDSSSNSSSNSSDYMDTMTDSASDFEALHSSGEPSTSKHNTTGSGSETIRKFFYVDIKDDHAETLEIIIPELPQASYSSYTWSCAPVMAQFLWEHRQPLADLSVLEIGCGTGLPGILAAKCGARVILSDSILLPKTLAHVRRVCEANNLTPDKDIQVVGLTWGLLLHSVFNLPKLDLIIGSDCFYDPSEFEDILVTLSFLLERNSNAKALITYEERSADWCMETLLKKWQLKALHVDTEDLGKESGVDMNEFIAGHSIHLLEITRLPQNAPTS